ncbi:sugar kinase [Propioniciclava sp. MC1595]|uniref:sugar kinase n=1 Tax=Propioniciclava sp. MC1595 TaxID=2760308 RepID=UPI0016628486|nr:sugar kinase [Propioniciclava sp. MC1595]MBB1496370.1 sugar kinase [Propioniciclava sp. MC1595]QTE26805.1 sugar kinase [Propioniciclava sp. MC1595]
MTDLLTVGEALVSFRTPRIAAGWTPSAHVAGAESNVAIGLARWGHSARWVGRVSADSLGDWVLATLAGEGVDTSFAVRDAAPAGVMVLESPADHARRVTYVRTGSAGSRLAAGDVLAALPGCRRVHLTGVTMALSDSAGEACLALARAAHAEGVPVSLDVNHRPALWSEDAARAALVPLMPYVSVLIASEEELPLVEASAAAAVDELVVKRGERGASVFWAGREAHMPARKIEVVDVIGAGDALCAGYLSGRLDGLDPGAALARGVDVAAACVGSAGDWEGLPHRHVD